MKKTMAVCAGVALSAALGASGGEVNLSDLDISKTKQGW